MALASLFIRQSVSREFDSYVIAQQRASFVDEASSYYETHRSWAGIDRWVRDQALSRLLQATPGPASGRRDVLRLRFVLADQAGVVVVPFGRYALGASAPPEDIARGTPVTLGGAQIGTVITPDLADVRNAAEDRYLARTDRALGIAAAVMVAVALLLGLLLARLITRPVRELTAAAEKIAGGELDQRVPVRSRDELGVLAAQFNRMSGDLARATQLRRQMTADVAHDLRTPLTVIAGYLEALRDQVLKPTPARFATMYDETRLLLHLVEDLHTLSLADAGELRLDRQPIAPRQLLERVAETYCHPAEQQGVELRVEAPEDLPAICVDVEQMTRAVSNLVANALRYTPAGGTITLQAHRIADRRLQIADYDKNTSTQPTIKNLQSTIALEVSDTGAGISPEHLPSIFERFYRADATRQQATGGSGLGLAIVKSIVEAHGGQVSAASIPGRGTTISIVLPVQPEA